MGRKESPHHVSAGNKITTCIFVVVDHPSPVMCGTRVRREGGELGNQWQPPLPLCMCILISIHYKISMQFYPYPPTHAPTPTPNTHSHTHTHTHTPTHKHTHTHPHTHTHAHTHTLTHFLPLPALAVYCVLWRARCEWPQEWRPGSLYSTLRSQSLQGSL